MSQLTPSEEELHAYIDERLEPVRRREVELYLAANPEIAARIEGWRLDTRHVRAALAGGLEQPLSPSLQPAVLRRQWRERRRRRWATAAMLLVALGAGGLGGWQIRDASRWADAAPMADALQAHRLFAQATAFDLRAQQPSQLQGWLDQHFARVGQLPDLSGYGFRAVGARLLSNEQGPAALLLFEDVNGERISLFLRLPGEHYVRMPSGQRTEGALQARYWSSGAYNYALVSAATDPRMEQVRQVLGVSL